WARRDRRRRARSRRRTGAWRYGSTSKLRKNSSTRAPSALLVVAAVQPRLFGRTTKIAAGSRSHQGRGWRQLPPRSRLDSRSYEEGGARASAPREDAGGIRKRRAERIVDAAAEAL